MNDTGRRINVEDAKIKTATVEIKSLTVSGKQVTLAVFRQLIEEPIIDQVTGELCGLPWGHVNYHSGVDCDYFKNDDYAAEHMHIVWQKGNELRRACVRFGDSHMPREGLWAAQRAADNWGAHWLCNAVAQGLVTREEVQAAGHRWRMDGGRYILMPARIKTWLDSGVDVDSMVAVAYYRETPASDILNNYEEALRKAEHLKHQFDESYALLEELDQLFIAV